MFHRTQKEPTPVAVTAEKTIEQHIQDAGGKNDPLEFNSGIWWFGKKNVKTVYHQSDRMIIFTVEKHSCDSVGAAIPYAAHVLAGMDEKYLRHNIHAVGLAGLKPDNKPSRDLSDFIIFNAKDLFQMRFKANVLGVSRREQGIVYGTELEVARQPFRRLFEDLAADKYVEQALIAAKSPAPGR